MEKKVVAAFDFDGTISKRDTFIPFALFIVGPSRWLVGLFSLIPSTVKFMFRKMSRQKLKEKTMTVFLQGISYKELRREGHEFAHEVIPKLLKIKALEQLFWHQEQGHTVILVSASPEVYLTPWAEKMGINHVCASKLALDDDGNVSGKLDGLNCRGKEKVRRLQELLGDKKEYVLYAYGDSPGDREMLSLADHAFYRKI